ncbi:MAG: hypothetical protein JOZ15_12370 [Acidobacteria bacterium]|nr:hypothetical protein [Acidobacteriota bacterium]
MSIDTLRLPSPFGAESGAYKDWLHLNLLDHATGAVGLINVSLHGAPWVPAARAVGVALLHLPGAGWVGSMEVEGAAAAWIGLASLALPRVALGLDPRARAVLASACFAEDGLEARCTATQESRPFEVRQDIGGGPGWIAWYAVPRLRLSGSVSLAGQALDLARTSAYHDQNWGCWHWGDGFGWEWGTFLAPPPGPSFVLSRVSNRAHHPAGPALLVADVAGRRRTFSGPAVEIAYEGRLETRLRRLPGALAALHGDRAEPHLPARMMARASAGVDHVEIDFRPRAAAQLIAGDPHRRGYGFLHEMVGDFTATGQLGSADAAATGLCVVEYVD